MNNRMNQIATRNGVEDYATKDITASKLQSLFNPSMTLYYVLIVLLSISWIALV